MIKLSPQSDLTVIYSTRLVFLLQRWRIQDSKGRKSELSSRTTHTFRCC